MFSTVQYKQKNVYFLFTDEILFFYVNIFSAFLSAFYATSYIVFYKISIFFYIVYASAMVKEERKCSKISVPMLMSAFVVAGCSQHQRGKVLSIRNNFKRSVL